MSTLKGKVVVITGASSGIGETTARLLASLGAHIVIGARRVERLEALASDIRADGGSVVVQQLDVTELEDASNRENSAKSFWKSGRNHQQCWGNATLTTRSIEDRGMEPND